MDMGNLLQGELESADVEHGMAPRKVVVRGRRCIAQARPIIQEGTTRGAVIAFQDISEIESLAQELNTVTTLFNEMDAIVSSLSDGLLVLDRNREIVYANGHMRKMFSDIFRAHGGRSAGDGHRAQPGQDDPRAVGRGDGRDQTGAHGPRTAKRSS